MRGSAICHFPLPFTTETMAKFGKGFPKIKLDANKRSETRELQHCTSWGQLLFLRPRWWTCGLVELIELKRRRKGSAIQFIVKQQKGAKIINFRNYLF